ncbi:MAG: hypothetical protein MJZ26_08485 [Fibrobacter sp.]|nr:hypothetical protein [Fibrobacter sp.]
MTKNAYCIAFAALVFFSACGDSDSSSSAPREDDERVDEFPSGIQDSSVVHEDSVETSVVVYDTVRYVSFKQQIDDSSFEYVTENAEFMSCEVVGDSFTCEKIGYSGLCGGASKPILLAACFNGLGEKVPCDIQTVLDTLKINYGEEPLTSYVPYVKMPEFDSAAAQSVFGNVKGTCGAVSEKIFTSRYSIYADSLPEGFSLDHTGEWAPKFCWSSDQYMGERITIPLTENYYESSCQKFENEGIPHDSISEFKTCSKRTVFSMLQIDKCWTSTTTYPMPMPEEDGYALYSTRTVPVDTAFTWWLKYYDMYGKVDSLKITTTYTK